MTVTSKSIHTNVVVRAPKKIAKKVIPTHFYVRVLSRHPSTAGLRKAVLIKGEKVVYRHGSVTKQDIEMEINSVDSVENSADKLKMKQAFDKAEVKHAKWFHLGKMTSDVKSFETFLKTIKFGAEDNWIIAKQRWSSRGEGNYLLKTKEELDKFIASKKSSLDNYIVEEYKHYSVEYRLHVSLNGCFYTNRKVLKNNTPKDERFQRHDDNCSWLLESNPAFNKPNNWDDIVKDCKNALKAIGADVLAFDVKCTSIKEKKEKKASWILIESCSAPSFGTGTLQHYKDELPKIIKTKYGI